MIISKGSERVSKEDTYLNCAEVFAYRSTCLKRKYGAVIVKNDAVLSTGYNGSPRGRRNCTDLGICMRNKLNIPRGERYELCRSVHAEANAIISASREQMIGATLYMVGINSETGELEAGTSSCMMCKRMVINAGISTVVVRDDKESFRIISVEDWIENDDSLSGIFGY